MNKKLYQIFMISLINISVSASDFSVEQAVAKMFIQPVLQQERKSKKISGGYNDTVYNQKFSVLENQTIKMTGRFKAFGLCVQLFDELAYKQLEEQQGKMMIVEYHPGIDLFGNQISPVQMSCSDVNCNDTNCVVDLQKITYGVFIKSKK